jgi:hypothetical protein
MMSVPSGTLEAMSGRRAKAKRKAATGVTTAADRSRGRWTLTGGAVEARAARITTVEHLRTAGIARLAQVDRLQRACRLQAAHLGNPKAAIATVFGGMGYQPPCTGDLERAAEMVVADEARYLGSADLYALTPQMCDVVVAAAQTLGVQDLELLREEDLPSVAGMVMLPHPIIATTLGGGLADIRALTWHPPAQIRYVRTPTREIETRSAVRISVYNDTHGPVQPDSFVMLTAQARRVGTPLPPLLLDAIRCMPFGVEVTAEQTAALRDFSQLARQAGDAERAASNAQGMNEERVIGEYVPGAHIDDTDDTFARRFLYAFWRLCEQRIAAVDDAQVGPTARLKAERAGVPAEVRIVQLRRVDKRAEDPSTGKDWQHRWVVRMHKVRQWYPSLQRHKVIYRGPYIMGPDDKPLLAGETVRGLTR